MSRSNLTSWLADLCFALALFVAMVGCNSIVSVHVDQQSLPNKIPELRRIVSECETRIKELEEAKAKQGFSASADDSLDHSLEVQRAIRDAALTKLDTLTKQVER